MNLDDGDLTPAGASLAGPVAPPVRQYTAAFVHTPGMYTHPDEIWSPRGSEIAPPGRPLPGQAVSQGHEAAGQAEPASQHTAEDGFEAAFGRVRQAIRPDFAG